MTERLIRWSWYVALLLSALALIGLGAAAAEGDGSPLRQVTILLSPPTGAALNVTGLPPSAGVPSALEIDTQVPLAIGTLNYVRIALRIAMGLFVLYQLRQVFSGGAREPFLSDRPRRIRLAGLGLIAGEALSILLSLAQELWLKGNVAAAGWRVSVDADRDVHLLLAGLVLIAVSEAYREGLALRRESDLTV